DAAATTSSRGRTTNDSFAIPINKVLDIARTIQSGQGTSTIHVGPRARLGITTHGGKEPVVADVESGSPAEGAGIVAGDTIASVDGKQISSTDGIVAALDK